MEQTKYHQMTVSQLRKIVRNLDNPPASGVAISGANKAQLLEWLHPIYTAPIDVEKTIDKVTLDITDKLKTLEVIEPQEPLVPVVETVPEPPQTIPPVLVTPSSVINGNALDHVSNLQSALQPFLSNVKADAVMDEARIIELIKEHQPKAREIVIKKIDMPDVNVGIQHCQFEKLLKNAVARVPVMLVGPSGSGKTHSAGQLAKALDLEYEALSCNPMTSKTDLLGYKDANGVYHDTALVRAFRDGKVLMLDEIDASNASVLTALNMATSNGQMATPIGMIDKHDNFVLVAGANTWGNGATPDFVGRNKLDLATKKRFFMLAWDYDETIEEQIADAKTAEELAIVSELQKYRAKARKLELRVSITPRDSMYGVRLLRAGMSLDEILQGLVFADLDEATSSKIKGA